MPGRKPRISWLPAPRPVPNSNRRFDTWSSIATRSATFAGWFTCGSGLKMPGADVDALGGVREVAGEHVVGRQVRVLVEEVVLRQPHVLEAGFVGGLRVAQVVHQRFVLGVGVPLPAELRVVPLQEDAELHVSPLRRRDSSPAAVTQSGHDSPVRGAPARRPGQSSRLTVRLSGGECGPCRRFDRRGALGDATPVDAGLGIGHRRDHQEPAIGQGLDQACPAGEIRELREERAHRVHGRLDRTQQPVLGGRTPDRLLVVAREPHEQRARGEVGADFDEPEPRLVHVRATVAPPHDLDGDGATRVLDRDAGRDAGEVVGRVGRGLHLDDQQAVGLDERDRHDALELAELDLELVDAHDGTDRVR